MYNYSLVCSVLDRESGVDSSMIRLQLIDTSNSKGSSSRVLVAEECCQLDLCEKLPNMMLSILSNVIRRGESFNGNGHRRLLDDVRVVFDFEQERNLTTIRILESFVNGLTII